MQWSPKETSDLIRLWENGASYDEISLVTGHTHRQIEHKARHLRDSGELSAIGGGCRIRVPEHDPLLERLRAVHGPRRP